MLLHWCLVQNTTCIKVRYLKTRFFIAFVIEFFVQFLLNNRDETRVLNTRVFYRVISELNIRIFSPQTRVFASLRFQLQLPFLVPKKGKI